MQNHPRWAAQQHSGPAATAVAAQSRGSDIRHIDCVTLGSELTPLSVPINGASSGRHNGPRVTLSEPAEDIVSGVEALIADPLQWPFHRCHAHLICLIPLRYQSVWSDGSGAAPRAQQVPFKKKKRRHKCCSSTKRKQS